MALPYPILRCLSRPRSTALRLAAGRSGGLPRRAGGAAIAAGENGRRQRRAGGRRGARSRASGAKVFLNFLSAHETNA